MALVECKECGKDISDSSKFCPHCGAPYTQAIGLSQSNKVGKIIGGLLTLIAGIILLIWINFREAPRYMSYELAEKYSDKASELSMFGYLLVGIGIIALMFAAKSKTK